MWHKMMDMGNKYWRSQHTYRDDIVQYYKMHILRASKQCSQGTNGSIEMIRSSEVDKTLHYIQDHS